jgi:alpha-ribazole phosphatase
MEVYLIRHTQTATPKGLCYGQTDVDLADNFVQEREKICQKLPKLKPDSLVFSSPLSRCVQLAESLSTKVILDKRLLEVNFGDWENQLFDALDSEIFRHWTDHFVTMPPPNGESFTDLCNRAEHFWQEIITLDTSQIFIITHAGIIRALLARLLQLPPANAFQFRVDCGSVHKLQRVDNYTHIHYLNR